MNPIDQARRAGAIAGANLRRAAGDKRVAFVAVVLPVIIMLLVGGIFGAGRHLVIGVVDQDHSALSARAVTLMSRSGELQVHVVPDPVAMHREIRRNLLLAGVVIPRGYGATLLAGGQGQVIATYDVGQPQAEAARAEVVAALQGQGDEVSAARYAHAAGGLSLAAGLRRSEKVVDDAYARVRSLTTRPPASAYSYTAPSNVVLFSFIIALSGSAGFVQSRRLGLTRRVLSTPTTAGAVVAGEAVGLLVAALIQSLILVLIGAVVLRVDFGSVAGVAGLIGLGSVAAAGAGMLLGTLARTPEQALAVGVPLGIGLGMLGGCMWSLDIVGPGMRALGHLAPQAWAMDGFVALIFRHTGVAGIARDLAALAVFAVVLFSAGALRLRRSVAAA